LKTVPASDLAVRVHKPEKAEGLKSRGVEVRQGDFDYPETLVTAFAGVDRILII
jgi:NAD(P)H dehydrogenase (quinone)